MTSLVSAHADAARPAATVYANIEDLSRWPEWSPDTEHVRLSGPFAAGTRGRMKLKGGPSLRFTITTVVPDREYTDVTWLPGARVTFQHLVEPATDGGSRLTADVSIRGPLAFVWSRVLGPGFRKSVPADLARLAAL